MVSALLLSFLYILLLWKANLFAFIDWSCSVSTQSWQSKAGVAFERKIIPMGLAGRALWSSPVYLWKPASSAYHLSLKRLILLVLSSHSCSPWAWCTLSCTFFTGLIFRLLDRILSIYYDCASTQSYGGTAYWLVCVMQPEDDDPLCLFLLKCIDRKIRYCICSAAFSVDMRLLIHNLWAFKYMGCVN